MKIKPVHALFFVFLILGCKAKETTVQTTQTSDTLITKSFDYKSEPITTNYSIQLECDSIGNIKPIQFKETSGKNKADLYIRDNVLNAKLLTGLSQFKTDTIYKTKFKDVYKDREVVRYKVSAWHWVFHLLAIIILFLVIKFKSLLPF